MDSPLNRVLLQEGCHSYPSAMDSWWLLPVSSGKIPFPPVGSRVLSHLPCRKVPLLPNHLNQPAGFPRVTALMALEMRWVDPANPLPIQEWVELLFRQSPTQFWRSCVW